MKIVFLFVLIMFSLVACVSQKKITDLEHPQKGLFKAEIANAWIPYDLLENNPMLKMGIYNDEICFISSKNDTYAVVFYTINGEKKRSVSIKRGKGPGELTNPSQSFIRNDRLCFYDRNRLLLSIFDMNGKFQSDIQCDKEQSMPYAVDLNGTTLYYNDPLSTKIGIIDFSESELPKVLKKITYDTLFTSTDAMMSQTPRYTLPFYDTNTGKLILSETDTAFTLSEFSNDLAFQHILISIPGSYMNLGAYCNKRYIFIPSMIDFKTLRESSSLKTPFKIHVIDREAGTHSYTLVHKEIIPINGLFTILGEIEDYLIIDVTLFDQKTSYAAFSKRKYPTEIRADHWVLVIKTPDI